MATAMFSCSPEEQPPRILPPVAENNVASEFEAICRSQKASYDVRYGERRLNDLESAISHATARGQLLGSDPRLVQLAEQLIRFGRIDEALSILEKAVPEPGPEGEFARDQLLSTRLIAHLQAAEELNCVLDHSAASCILPIRAESVHKLPDHARRAGDLAAVLLERNPDSSISRWLLNLTRMLSGDYPEGVPKSLRLPETAFKVDRSKPHWWNRGPALGIDTVDLAGGAIMDDFDGDGLLDLITSTQNPCDHMKAFRNDGHGGFEDVTEAWGLDVQLGGLNLVHADYDGDGDLDILVLRGGWQTGETGRVRNSLLRNEIDKPQGSFVDVTRAAGLAEPARPTLTAAWADYDLDGDLDLYVGNQSSPGYDNPSQLFRNNGDGTFTEVAGQAGVTNDRYAAGVAWGDYDDDGDPDLYVSNMSGPNRFYRNAGDGTFSDVAKELGVEGSWRNNFATWFFDYDNDGDLDLLVADYSSTTEEVFAYYLGKRVRTGGPLLFRNNDGAFYQIGASLGLARPILAMGANYGDLDNDGWLDIYFGTGEPAFQALMPNVMLRNIEGVLFEDVSFSGGFAHVQKGHGVAFGDLDNDGDQDILHQLGGTYVGDAYGNVLFENPGSDNNWITLRLEGVSANRFGVGARIEVRVRRGERVHSIHVLVGSGGSFGASSLQQEIGLGASDSIEEIRIRWPGSGTTEIFSEVAMDHIYRVVEGTGTPELLELPKLRLNRAPPKTPHRHHDKHSSAAPADVRRLADLTARTP